MKTKINLTAEYKRRISMTIIGIFICSISVGMFNYSTFGMDPFQVFAHGISYQLPVGFGLFYTLLNLFMFIFILILDRSKIGLGTFLNIFLVGYIVQFSSWFFVTLFPDQTFGYRVFFLIAGILLLCFGSSLYFTANMGVSTYDAVALILADRKIAKFQYCRIATDLLCTLIGFFFGAIVGIGTLVTAFFMGPIIAFFNIKIAIPLRYGKRAHIE